MKQFFDGALYDAQLQALTELVSSANTLAAYWTSMNEKHLDAEIYSHWLTDKDAIFRQYQKETVERFGTRYWNNMTYQAQRPELDDVSTSGKFLRIFSGATTYVKPFFGMRIFVNVQDIAWKDGIAYVTDDTLKNIKSRCTFKPTATDEKTLNALERYVDAHNEIVSLTGVTVFPVRYDGKASVDIEKYFRNRQTT